MAGEKNANNIKDLFDIILDMTLREIQENAAVNTTDRRKNMQFFEWENEEVLVRVEIVQRSPDNPVDLIEQITDPKEKAVVQRLANGDRQMDIANDMNISQTTVSIIKKKHSALIATLIAATAAMTMSTPVAVMTGMASVLGKNQTKKK